MYRYSHYLGERLQACLPIEKLDRIFSDVDQVDFREFYVQKCVRLKLDV